MKSRSFIFVYLCFKYHILDVPTKWIFPRQSLLLHKIWLQLIKNNCLNGSSITNTKNQLHNYKQNYKKCKMFSKVVKYLFFSNRDILWHTNRNLFGWELKSTILCNAQLKERICGIFDKKGGKKDINFWFWPPFSSYT